MRLVLTSDDRIAVLRDGSIVDVSAAFDDIPFRTSADRMPRVLAVLNERRARIEMINSFQRIDTLSAEARDKLMAAMAQEKRASEAALATAQRNIQELKDAASDMAEAWKRGAIPADIVCGVFNGKGCPAPAYPATGSDRDDSLEVRDGAAAAAANAAPGVP